MCEWCGQVCDPVKREAENVFKMFAIPKQKSNINLHHLTYESIGNEQFGDLLVCCRDCHEELHVIIDRLRKGRRSNRYVMQKLAPVCKRRIISIHETHLKLQEMEAK